jgi:hypothetical protein
MRDAAVYGGCRLGIDGLGAIAGPILLIARLRSNVCGGIGAAGAPGSVGNAHLLIIIVSHA